MSRKKTIESLLAALCKVYFKSRWISEFDCRLLGVAIVSIAFGAGVPIPNQFKQFEEERDMLDKIIEKALHH